MALLRSASRFTMIFQLVLACYLLDTVYSDTTTPAPGTVGGVCGVPAQNTCTDSDVVCENTICKLKNGADCTAHNQDCVDRARCNTSSGSQSVCVCTQPTDTGDTCTAASPATTKPSTTAIKALVGDHCGYVAGSRIGNCTDNAECSMGICVCIMGFHSTADKHCKMTVGHRNCSNNSCVDNAECAQVSTDPTISECQCNSGFYATDDGICQGRKMLEEPCEPLQSGRSPCVQPDATACHNNTCECNEDYLPNNNSVCLPKLLVDAHCVNTQDMCVQGANCILGICTCDIQHYKDNTKHCQDRIAPGHPCISGVNDPCKEGALCNPNNVCECVDHRYRHKNDSCAPVSLLGGQCQTAEDCMDNANCTRSHCVCPNDRFYNQTLENCQLRKPAGSACIASEECAENADCIESHCRCKSQYYENNQQCYRRQLLGHECLSSIPNQCLINGECVNELCQCNNKSYNNEDVSCPLTLGFNETCNWENRDPRQCISNTTCIFRPFDSKPACGCDIDHFFNGLFCMKRALAGESCPYYTANSYGLNMPHEEFEQQCVENAYCTDRRICECKSEFYDKAGYCPPRIASGNICDPWRDYPLQCQGNAHCLYGRCVSMANI